MNCINCYHYDACASVDVTGYVVDFEHEEECEHFKTAEDVRPTGHWVRKVKDYGSDNVHVDYHCSRCDEKAFGPGKMYNADDWYGYFKDHHDPNPKYMYKHCPECGAEMDLENTDHTNHYVYKNREEESKNYCSRSYWYSPIAILICKIGRARAKIERELEYPTPDTDLVDILEDYIDMLENLVVKK